MTRELMRQGAALFLGFDSLVDGGPARGALHAAIEAEGGEELWVDAYERAAVQRRAAAHDYPTMKAKHRQELGRKRRRLEDELGAALETTDQAADPSPILSSSGAGRNS